MLDTFIKLLRLLLYVLIAIVIVNENRNRRLQCASQNRNEWGKTMTRNARIKSIGADNPFISKQDLICKVLISEILNRELRCGDPLSQNKLSADFNLSRGPVKLALEKLERYGFLVHDETGSFYVNKPDIRFNANIRSIKRQLDLLAASQALYDISKDKLELVQKGYINMAKAFHSKNYVEFFHCDLAFHQTIVDASQNIYLKDIYNRYQDLFLFMSICSEADERLLGRLLYQHQKIFTALKNRQSEALQAAIYDHYSSKLLF